MPKSLAIIGAGAVGVEFASIFHRFGSKVTIFEMLPRLVPVEDEEVSKELERVFKKQRHSLRNRRKRRATFSRPTTGVRFTRRPWPTARRRRRGEKSAGRRGPQAQHRQASAWKDTRIETDRGFIKVDAYQQTGEPGVYAIGDIVAGTPQLAHVATVRAWSRWRTSPANPSRRSTRNRIPGATYTEPGIGSVGLTEAQAQSAGLRVKVGKFPFVANSKATILGSTMAS